MTQRDFVLGEAIDADDATTIPVAVPEELRYLEGHFPGNPVVPGVAQVVLVERAIRRRWADLGPSRGIERLKFRRRIEPGDQVDVVLVRQEDRVRFSIRRGDEECSHGNILF